MCMTYYTVDDLRPGRPGWDVRQFSALAEAITHYRTLPMDGVRVLGMADDVSCWSRSVWFPFPIAESCGKSCGRRFSGRAMKETMIPPFALFL